jgi:hypothetical protein
MNVFVTGVLADVQQPLKPFYSDIGRPSVERVVAACMANGLIKGEGFAFDASVSGVRRGRACR